MAIKILTVGPLTTVQDFGRSGFGSRGYRRCGACDKYSMQIANILAGNMEDCALAAVLEFTLSGGKMEFTDNCQIALAGADMSPKLNGNPIAMYRSVKTKAGDILELGMAVDGLRTYLAVGGGIDTEKVMSSRATDCTCGIGGMDGRAIREGDVLKTGVPGKEKVEFAITEEMFWLNKVDSDRMAVRLEGPELKTKEGSDIISDGIVEGSVQISSNGLPMVMLADHQTTGGYAKIATVLSTDIPAIAQRRPGECIGFEYITPAQAGEAYRKEVRKLSWLKKEIVMKQKNRK